jgi:hypothetical protein
MEHERMIVHPKQYQFGSVSRETLGISQLWNIFAGGRAARRCISGLRRDTCGQLRRTSAGRQHGASQSEGVL